MGNQTTMGDIQEWTKIDWLKSTGSEMSKALSISAMAAQGFSQDVGHVEEMWLSRQSGLLEFVCGALCSVRDAGFIKMEPPILFKALELSSIRQMIQIEWIDVECLELARRYLDSLPCYDHALSVEDQSASAQEAHDFLRFGLELPLRKALGLGFGDHPMIGWDRIPTTRLEKLAIEERIELQACLDKKPKKTHRRL